MKRFTISKTKRLTSLPKANKNNKQVRKTNRDVVVRVPAAVSTVTRTRVPKGHFDTNGLTINHKELLARVSGTAAFTATSYVLNPAVPETFPWLSPIATRFEYYHIRSLRVLYVPRCPTTTAGTLSMAFDKDVLDPDPISYRSLLSYQGAVSTPAWSAASLAATSSQLTPQRLYNAITPAAGSDQRLYDWGKLIFATEGAEADYGDLFLEYQIAFTNPEFNEPNDDLHLKFDDDSTKTTGEFPSVLANQATVEVFRSLATGLRDLKTALSQSEHLEYWKGGLGMIPNFGPLPEAYKGKVGSGDLAGIRFTHGGRYLVRFGMRLYMYNASAQYFTARAASGLSFTISDQASDVSAFQNLTMSQAGLVYTAFNSANPATLTTSNANTQIITLTGSFYFDAADNQVCAPVVELETTLGLNFNWYISDVDRHYLDIIPCARDVSW